MVFLLHLFLKYSYRRRMMRRPGNHRQPASSLCLSEGERAGGGERERERVSVSNDRDLNLINNEVKRIHLEPWHGWVCVCVCVHVRVCVCVSFLCLLS